MVKKMNKNKIIAILTVIAAILIVALPTLFKIYWGYEERTFLVASKKVLESASDCYRASDCHGEVTIKELRSKGYLVEPVINPRTKTYFDESIVLVATDYEVTFLEK